MNVAEMREDYDWQQALDVATGPRGVDGYAGSLAWNGWDDVAEVVAADPGENDGPNWIAALRLTDGRFAWLSAGCDYTGWDCQAGGSLEIAASLEDLIRLAMGTEDRRRLGYMLPGETNEIPPVDL